MEFTAPDGHIITFIDSPVFYEINPSNYYENGVYIDLFTEGNSTPIGIKQQRVIKTQANGVLNIEIRWSTNQELLDYIESVKQEQLRLLNLTQ
jgi:altronate dehydratase